MPTLTFKSNYPIPPDDLFAWHERPGAIERLSPPWMKTVVEDWEGIGDGHRAVIRINNGPVSTKWTAIHEEYVRGKQFIDYQEEGPFQYWRHVHRFEPFGDNQSQLIDEIDFQLPGGALGERVASGFVRSQIERAFEYRHQVLGQDLLLHQKYNLSKVSLQIGITGSSGLIGSALSAFFSSGGHKVTRIVRHRTNEPRTAYWNPDKGEIDRPALEGLDVIIHLAGESPFRWKWNPATKTRIRESRVRGTKFLAETIASLDNPPGVFLSASGISIYGDHSGQRVSEASALRPGGYLSTVAKEWEAAADPVVKKGIRFVFLRFGVVLSPRGGVLGRILPLFRAGLGGCFTGGDQWVSWISIDDVIGAIYHVMMSTTTGPVNLVTPTPVTTAQFARTIGRVLRRPSLLRVPRSVARLLAGEIADELYFESVRATPAYLTTAGYQYLHPLLEDALLHLLGRTRVTPLDLAQLRSDTVIWDDNGGPQSADRF